MTTRNIALAVDDTVLPDVAAELATRGIHLGHPTTINGVRCYHAHGPFPVTKPVDLSQKDVTILHALADGHTYDQIARILGVSSVSARNYAKRRLYRRLGARDRCEAVAIAYRMGALDQWEAAA
ncbi:helix-turn-helix domain-containing protein [Amycolatopsis sp. NPDC004772]